MKYGSTTLSHIRECVEALIEDEGIDALAGFTYVTRMLPARRPTKIDTRILAAVHDEIIYNNPAGCEVDPCVEDEAYNIYRRTLNL